MGLFILLIKEPKSSLKQMQRSVLLELRKITQVRQVLNLNSCLEQEERREKAMHATGGQQAWRSAGMEVSPVVMGSHTAGREALQRERRPKP